MFLGIVLEVHYLMLKYFTRFRILQTGKGENGYLL